MATPRTKLPQVDRPTKIHFSLSAVEAEHSEDEVIEPFSVDLNDGKPPIVFNDPRELPWQDLMQLESPYEMADLCIETEEDRMRFLKVKMSGRVVGEMTSAFRRHYGMTSSGKARGSAG